MKKKSLIESDTGKCEITKKEKYHKLDQILSIFTMVRCQDGKKMLSNLIW